MAARILTKYNGNAHDGKGYLHLDFDKIGKDSISLEMEIKGVAKDAETFWKVTSNGYELDTNDLTRGKFAEFKMLNTYAGSPDAPHIFTITVIDKDSNILATLEISVFAKPKITNAYWSKGEEKRIYEATINSNFTALLQGVGVYNIPLDLQFYFVAKSGEDVKIDMLSQTISIQSYNDAADFNIGIEVLKKHKMFFLGNTPTIFMDYLSGSLKLDLTGNMRDLVIAKAYFTISHNKHMLFDGKRNKEILNITFTLKSFEPEEKTRTIAPVLVGTDVYFTQKYEPCKYEKISYIHKDPEPVVIFDEKKPTTKDKNGNLKNDKIEIAVIAPPIGSKNIKEIKLILEKVETLHCSFEEENKTLAGIEKGNNLAESLPHKGRVIDCKNLKKADIEIEIINEDKEVNIKPTFNYRYNKDSAWEFMKHYFLFSTLLDSKDVLQNEIKGKLIGWEAESKGVIDAHKIKLETCRYQKSLDLKIFADVAWAYHIFYDEPTQKKYYLEDEDIATKKGLEDQISWMQDNNQKFDVLAPIDILGIKDSINDFVLDLVIDMAEKYELGFTAYYDFNGAGKCENRIEYAKQFPNVFDAAIAGAVTLEILIQVALLILTEGATAELALAKLGKAGVKLPGKFAKMSSKAAVNIDEISKTRSIVSKIDKAYTILKAPAFTYYKGYRFAEGEEIGIEPLLEEKLAFSPLLDLKHLHERSLGELVLKKTAVGIVINLTQKALSGLKIGFNRFILSKENRSTAKLVDHYVGLVEDGVNVVEDYLSFLTDRIIKNVFGVGAKYSLEVSGQFGMDFELKIHNASHTLDLKNFLRKESVKDASVATAAPSAGMNVLMKVEAKVKLPVRAMNILNYSDISNTKISKAEGDLKLKVQSGIFWERKFFYHASDKKPYYQDTVIFTGICGEYEHKLIGKGKENDKNIDIDIRQEPNKFILIPSQILNHSPIPYFKNPLDYI